MGAVSHKAWREAQTRQGQYQIATADSGKSDAKAYNRLIEPFPFSKHCRCVTPR